MYRGSFIESMSVFSNCREIFLSFDYICDNLDMFFVFWCQENDFKFWFEKHNLKKNKIKNIGCGKEALPSEALQPFDKEWMYNTFIIFHLCFNMCLLIGDAFPFTAFKFSLAREDF